MIVCEPLLSEIDLRPYLDSNRISAVCAGGESGDCARVCDFAWVEKIANDCRAANVSFHYHQTGALLRHDGKIYRIPRRQQVIQAKRANVDFRSDRGLLRF